MAKTKIKLSLKSSIYFGLSIFLVIVLAFWLRFSQLGHPARYIFDEDYFAFTSSLITHNQITAYEYWHLPFVELSSPALYRAPAVEWLHPPISKLFMATSIYVLGNSPLSWRLIPALCGVILVLVSIFLSLKLFPQHKSVALLTGMLIAVDHLLVVESRLAGANMILTLLTTTTVFLTVIYGQKQKSTDSKQIFWSQLMLLGIVAGLAIATKWSAVFILIGCWCWLLWRSWSKVSKQNWRHVKLGLLTFLVIPIIVYLISYSQFFLLNHFDIKAWWQLQTAMFGYQTKTQEQHAFQSRPWQWPLNQVAIPYYLPTKNESDNQAIWASSILLPISFSALTLTMAWLALVKKNKMIQENDTLLVIVALCFWFPWFLIPRNLFLYHIMPIMPVLLILLSRRLINLGQWLANTLKKPKS